MLFGWAEIKPAMEQHGAMYFVSVWDHALFDSLKDKADWILERANTDPILFRAGLIFAAKLIERGDELPENLKNWIKGNLLGTVCAPRKLGKPQSSRELLSVVLGGAVVDLVKRYELRPFQQTFRSNSTDKSYSACQAVSEGWNDFRKALPSSRRKDVPTLSYSTVRDAFFFYKDYPKNFEIDV